MRPQVLVVFASPSAAEFAADALRDHAGHVDDPEDAADLRDLADHIYDQVLAS